MWGELGARPPSSLGCVPPANTPHPVPFSCGKHKGSGDKSVPTARGQDIPVCLTPHALAFLTPPPGLPPPGKATVTGAEAEAHHFSTSTLQAWACANSWLTRVSSESKCFL